jgi:Galactose oxidase, central domain
VLSEWKGVAIHFTGQHHRNTVLTILVASITLTQWAHAQPTALLRSRANPSGVAPSPRIDAPVAYDPLGRQLFMFGGLDSSGDRNDLWAYFFDNQQWTQIKASGLVPNPRHGHTLTFDSVRRRVVVIAGQGAGFFGDAWAYDILTNTWSQLSGNSSGPNPRYGHSGGCTKSS